MPPPGLTEVGYRACWRYLLKPPPFHYEVAFNSSFFLWFQIPIIEHRNPKSNRLLVLRENRVLRFRKTRDGQRMHRQRTVEIDRIGD
jgi:hypothetical protein